MKFYSTIHTTHRLGAPQGWDDSKNGPCDSLPLNLNDGQYSSWWRVSFRDRLRILFGASVRLTCAGSQPPVNLAVEKAPLPEQAP